MPSSAEANRAQFVETFNRLLGNKTGKPLKFYTDKSIKDSISDEDRRKAAVALAKPKTDPKISVPKLSPTVTNTGALLNLPQGGILNKVAQQGGIGPQVSIGDLPDIHSGGAGGGKGILDFIKDKISGALDYVGIIDKENPEGTAGNTYSDVVNAINTSTPAQTVAGGTTRVLDVVNRPSYAINEALKRQAEDINEGNGWSLPKDFVQGAWKGLQGQKKTGFGQVVETAAPGLPLNAKRALGAVGDIGLDPITYASGGTDIVAKDATNAGLRAGLDATGKDAIKHEVGKVVQDVLDHTNALDDLNTVKGGYKVDTKAIMDSVINEVKDKLDTIAYDTKKGEMIGGRRADAHGTLSQVVAESIRDRFITAVKRPVTKFLAALEEGRRFSEVELKAMRKNKLFSTWLDGANEAIDEANALHKSITPTEVADKAFEKFSATLSPKMDEIYSKTLAGLDDTVMRIPRINFLNQELYLPRLGKALQKADLAGRIPENLKKAFNYSSWMPGYTSHITQKMRSINKLALDQFKSEVEEAFKGSTALDRREVKYATEHSITLTGRRGEMQAYQEQAYRDMFNQEGAGGVRDITGPNGESLYAPDYTFNKIIKGQNNQKSFESDWRKPKKASVAKNQSIKGFTAEDAIAKGMHVEKDAAAALIYRKMRSMNKLSVTYLEKDLLTHYGIASAIPLNEAVGRNMVKVSAERQPWLKDVLKPGQTAYLDKDIYKVMENYKQLTSFRQTAEANDLVRSIEKATQIFKQANTIYWPGFHIRNAISDIFMGALDGVKSRDYGVIGKAMFNKDKAFLKMGNESVEFRKILDSYQRNASSGFIDSELNIRTATADLSTTRFMDALTSPSAFNAKLRDMSQVREDFGRLVHYYHAMNEEYGHLISKGVSKEKAWKGAEEAAIQRVNKYKFDYTALTPFEQKIRAYGIPFYTYMRKATPVLVENLFMNPRYFSYINKLQRALAPSDEFKANDLPTWMNEQAYSQLSSADTKEPVGFTDALFPTRTLADAFRNPVIGANPVIQAGFELNSGKDTFTGKPVAGLTDILKNKFKGTTQYSSAVGDKVTFEKWATFLGIPVYKVTQARQDGKMKELTFQLSQKVQSINKKIESKGLKLSIRHNQIYLINPKTDTSKEKVLGVYNTFAELPFKV